MNLNTKSCDVLLFKLSSQMTLDECSLCRGQSAVAIADAPPVPSKGRNLPNIRRLADLPSSIRTFPVPPSPTRTSLKVGTCAVVSAMVVVMIVCWWDVVNRGDRKCQAAIKRLAGQKRSEFDVGSGFRRALCRERETDLLLNSFVVRLYV